MISEFKMYFYGAIVTIALAFSVFYTFHERHVGEAKIQARDVVINTQRQKLADAATQHAKDVQALAQELSDKIGETFENTITAPVVAPHVLCYRPVSPSRSQVPSASGGKPIDLSTPVERAEAPVDLGPPVVTVGRDADAQINALIDEVQVLLDAMNGKTK